jgi:hypothetical protein
MKKKRKRFATPIDGDNARHCASSVLCLNDKGKGKGHPVTGNQGPRGGVEV